MSPAMEVIPRRVDPNFAAAEKAGLFPLDSDYDLVLDRTAAVVDAETGRPVAVLVKGGIPPKMAKRTWLAIRGKIKGLPDNRRMAAGKGAALRISSSGRNVAVSRGATTPSGAFADTANEVLGFLDGKPGGRNPMCRQSAFTAANIGIWNEFVPLCRKLAEVYAEYLPEFFAAQTAYAEGVPPEFRIPGTPFTTVTLNRNWQVAYHTDAGDYRGGFGVMLQWRAGSFTGGRLVIPAYKIAVEYGTGDVCFADVHQLHAVTRLVGLKGSWERIVGVFYLREGLWRCNADDKGAPAEEKS